MRTKCEEQSEQQATTADSLEMAEKNAERQVADTLAALESSNAKIAELESLLASRNEEMSELAEVRTRNSELEEELTAAQLKVTETASCAEQLKLECSELRELEISRSASVDLRACELQESLVAAKQQLSAAENEKQCCANQLEHVQQLLKDLTEKYSGLEETHAALQTDFDNMKQAFDQLKRDNLCSNDHTVAVIEECATLKNTIENLTVQHDAVLAEKQAVCQEIAELRSSLNDSLEQCEKMKARENLLCRGIVELNCFLFDKTSALSTDVASLLLFSDSDMQNFLSRLLSQVAGVQKNLELNVKQVEDERSLREKVEREKAALAQERDATYASVHSLKEENEHLSSTVKELENMWSELTERCNAYESQVVQLQVELKTVSTRSDVAGEVERTNVSPVQNSVYEKDAEIERLHQEIRAYKLDIERLERERELHADPNQQMLRAAEESNVEIQNFESDNNTGVQKQVSDVGTDYSGEGNDTLPSGNVGELLDEERDESKEELLEMKAKMGEWEAMMQMLQRERDDIQLELQKLEQKQKRIFSTVDEVLQCILNSMKGRDLFPANSEALVGDDGGDSELWGKLALLRTVADELVFEMDEMKEKVHHMTDEVRVSEQKVSELEAERKTVREECEAASLQLQSVRKAEAASRKREQELVAEAECVKSSVSELAADLKHKDALIEELRTSGANADKLSAEIELLHTEVANRDRLVSELEAEREVLKEEAKEKSGQLERLCTSEESLKKRELKLAAEIEHMKNAASEVAEDVKDKDVLMEKLQVLGASADKLNAEVELLRAEVADKDRLLSDARILEQTLQQSLNECREDVKNSELNVSAVESKYSAEVAALQIERDQLLTKVAELQKECDVLRQESYDLQRKYDDKCREAAELSNSVSAYDEQFDVLKERLKAEECENRELKADHAKLADALKEAEFQRDRLGAETSEINSARVALEQKLCDLQEESEQKVKLSESRISRLEDSLSAVQMDFEKTSEQKLAAENELGDCGQKLELTSARLSQAENECSRLTAELLQVKSELQHLKDECKVQADQTSTTSAGVESIQKSGSSCGVETAADSSTAQVCFWLVVGV